MRSSSRSITIHALRAAGAARRRAGTKLVRQQRDVEPIGRQHVGADHVGGGVVRQRHAIGRAGAVVVAELAAQREHAAVGVDRHLHVPVLVALVIGGDEILAAVLDPFQRRGRAAAPRPAPPAPPDGTAPSARSRRRHRARPRGPGCSAKPSASTMTRLARCGIWVLAQTVSNSSVGIEAGEHAARLDRMAAALVQAEALRRCGARRSAKAPSTSP